MPQGFCAQFVCSAVKEKKNTFKSNVDVIHINITKKQTSFRYKNYMNRLMRGKYLCLLLKIKSVKVTSIKNYYYLLLFCGK